MEEDEGSVEQSYKEKDFMDNKIKNLNYDSGAEESDFN